MPQRKIGDMRIDREAVAEICVRNDVARLRVFGSVARGEDTPGSDIDLLVEFTRRKSLLDLVGIEQEFEDALGRKVDLVTPAALSPYLREQVLREARVLYERRAA
jgi:predicted nucleotidyltransferase